MDGKHCGDHLPKQLEDARLKIKKLQKQINELSSSRNLIDDLVVSSDKGISAEVAEVKLLKKQLKFEKKRVKHARDVAKLEKRHSNLLQQEVGRMKLELIQFLNCLDALDKCFSTPAGGIDDMEKIKRKEDSGALFSSWLGVDGVGYEDKEVEDLRVKLSAFLWRETTIRAGRSVQLATVTALFGLISLDFEKVILDNVKLPVMSGQFVAADLIRNWFSLLTEEQRAMSIRLFLSVD
ncbi:hypothetical protein CRYUN_Cryun40dG0052800 [Craigia yunnanensis]